jgi:tetratricopeptide (TPR) repeat protein
MKAHQPNGRAPLTHTENAAEGADLLSEVHGPAGVLLWGALRDLMLWVETPAERRAGVFGTGAGEMRRRQLATSGVDRELWGPLLTLAQMTDEPHLADRGRVVFAARSIARWAERHPAPCVRLAFTQAAALAVGEDPRLGLETARIARDMGRVAQAESWFRHTVRRSRGYAWDSYVWAYIGLGVMYVRAGNYPAAHSVFSRALRSARKHRMRTLEGAALHHLFTCALDDRDIRKAYGYASAALAAYTPGHPRIAALASDLARVWLHMGECARALPVLEALEPLMPEAHERMVAAANSARAAAGAGERPRYEAARRRAIERIAANAAGTRVAETWAILASADAAAGEWDRVYETAGRAVELAEVRGESEALVLAEAQLEAARTRMASRVEDWVAEPAGSAREGTSLAGELLVRISEMELASR